MGTVQSLGDFRDGQSFVEQRKSGQRSGARDVALSAAPHAPDGGQIRIELVLAAIVADQRQNVRTVRGGFLLSNPVDVLQQTFVCGPPSGEIAKGRVTEHNISGQRGGQRQPGPQSAQRLEQAAIDTFPRVDDCCRRDRRRPLARFGHDRFGHGRPFLPAQHVSSRVGQPQHRVALRPPRQRHDFQIPLSQ